MPTGYQWFVGEFIPAISRTLVHSLWQGMIAALIAGIIILCTRKTNAAIRYNALLFLYGSLIMTVAVTFFLEIGPASVYEKEAFGQVSVSQAKVTDTNAVISDGQSDYVAMVLGFIDRYSILLVSTWFLFFVFHLLRMAFGFKEIRMIRQKGIHQPSTEWKEWIEKKSTELGIQQSIVLLQSAVAKVPVAIGYLKPVILVPIGLLTQLSTAQAEAVLLHELAHIKRKDYLVNLVQSFVDAVFFYNPAFLWLSSLIRQEREKCCDDLVIVHTNNQNNYLEALVSFQEMNLPSTYSMAIASKKYYLLNRVKRILTRENSRLSAKETSSLLIVVVSIAIAFMAFKPISPRQTAKVPSNHIDTSLPNQTTITGTFIMTDTVPDKFKPVADRTFRFKKVISNIVDDGENNSFQIQATEENGTVYKIRRSGNEVTSFSINDKEIPKSEYKEYTTIMASIERARKKQLHKALKSEHNEFEVFSDDLRILSDSSMTLNITGEFHLNDSIFSQDKLFQIEPDHLFQLNLEPSADLFHQNPSVDAIVSDLVLENLIQSTSNLSFSLTNTELIVNGKTQSKAMHEKFKSKYIKHQSDRFKYSKQGKSTKTEININDAPL